MARDRRTWKVVIPSAMSDWQTPAIDAEWREAPDGVFPGYRAQRYDTEPQALEAARQLRATLIPGSVATFFDAATVPADD